MYLFDNSVTCAEENTKYVYELAVNLYHMRTDLKPGAMMLLV
jgi:hypothetical protein